MHWSKRIQSGKTERVLYLVAVLLVAVTAPVWADGPWGHAPNHGYSGVDAARHIVTAETWLHRHSDGSYMSVSRWAPNSYPAGVSFQNADGSVRTVYPVRTDAKLNSCIGNNCARSGYHLTDVSRAQQAQWAAQGLVRQAGSATMSVTPPTVVLVPGWTKFCNLGVETVTDCQRRLLAARKG